ncbi:MAG: hypothetical protein OSB70_03180 [Myxococcota bacterium]|nr:hypothetical protein [Myxococcota bacterium]
MAEVLDMSPESRVSWSFRHLSAPLVSLVRGSDHMYAQRRILVTTTPSDAYLDIFYVRSGFQKRFEQAEAPVTLLVPSRLDAGPRDSLTIRAFAEGYRQGSVTFNLGDAAESVELDLSPLPNRLVGVSHRYFAGRTSLSFLTDEALTFRLQEADDGYGVILTETSISDEAAASVAEILSPFIAESYSQQLGEDLMVKLVLSQRAQDVEVRSRQSLDAPRDLHVFSVDLVLAESAKERVERATSGLGSLAPDDVRGCALLLDQSIREQLDSGDLARALRPSGSFTDRYVRAAMRRMGELSPGGGVEFVDGSQLHPVSSLELEMALGNAAGAKGFLSLLWAFANKIESTEEARVESLRSLLAPQMTASRFLEILNSAREREQSCLDSG